MAIAERMGSKKCEKIINATIDKNDDPDLPFIKKGIVGSSFGMSSRQAIMLWIAKRAGNMLL